MGFLGILGRRVRSHPGRAALETGVPCGGARLVVPHLAVLWGLQGSHAACSTETSGLTGAPQDRGRWAPWASTDPPPTPLPRAAPSWSDTVAWPALPRTWPPFLRGQREASRSSRRFYHNIGAEHIGQIKLKFYRLPLCATSRPRGGGWILTGEKGGLGLMQVQHTGVPVLMSVSRCKASRHAGPQAEDGVWPALSLGICLWVSTGHVAGLQPLQVGEEACGPQKGPMTAPPSC